MVHRARGTVHGEGGDGTGYKENGTEEVDEVSRVLTSVQIFRVLSGQKNLFLRQTKNKHCRGVHYILVDITTVILLKRSALHAIRRFRMQSDQKGDRLPFATAPKVI